MVKPTVQPDAALSLRRPAADLATWDDAALLNAYIGSHDQEAFAQIAARYGAMVFRTCLRRLGSDHDAEDATQAVFLVLARAPQKARESLGGWLHKVAQDTAVTLLRSRARRAKREESAAMRKSAPPPRGRTGLREELDTTIARLPTQLREAVILCYLEGQRQEDAARMLGCNQGTLSRRAAEGLNLLRSLLQRRGVVVTASALAAFFVQQQAQAAVPAALVGSLKLAAGGSAAALSTQAGTLADATLKAAAVAKAKLAAGVVLAVAVVAGGTFAAFQRADEPARMVLQNFDGPTPPTNRAGAGYPSPYFERGIGGQFTASIDTSSAVAGGCLRLRLTEGTLKAQFDPEDQRQRTFTRNYVANPDAWQFNTYNRLVFWIRTPASARPHQTNGGSNLAVGMHIKDDRGQGEAFIHRLNVPNVGAWTQVVLNAHPHQRMGSTDSRDIGTQTAPPGDGPRNYFDALARFFIEDDAPSSYPADYFLDEMAFVHEPQRENDEQVYSLTSTFVPAQNRVLVTWSRAKQEDAVKHEVRYAFGRIQAWDEAVPAPQGVVTPPGKAARNGMVYDSTELPLAGHDVVYLAIKPQNADVFTQIRIPLTRK